MTSNFPLYLFFCPFSFLILARKEDEVEKQVYSHVHWNITEDFLFFFEGSPAYFFVILLTNVIIIVNNVLRLLCVNRTNECNAPNCIILILILCSKNKNRFHTHREKNASLGFWYFPLSFLGVGSNDHIFHCFLFIFSPVSPSSSSKVIHSPIRKPHSNRIYFFMISDFSFLMKYVLTLKKIPACSMLVRL